jgi:hypothetical protein
MKQKIFNPRIFENTDDKDITWFEVVYFINYGQEDQDIIWKGFDTLAEAENHLKNKSVGYRISNDPTPVL